MKRLILVMAAVLAMYLAAFPLLSVSAQEETPPDVESEAVIVEDEAPAPPQDEASPLLEIATDEATEPDPSVSPPPPTPGPVTIAPQEFKGKGKSVSATFTLQQGLSVFHIRHQNGKGHYSVWLMDSAGAKIDLMANTTGAYDGWKAIEIKQTGTYIMDIDADGEWAVTVEQPRVTEAPGLPQVFNGKGDGVSPFFYLSPGLATFEMKHNGRGHFSIWLYKSDGDREDLLANTTGAFEGAKAIGVAERRFMDASVGPHVLSIQADGEWSISVRQ